VFWLLPISGKEGVAPKRLAPKHLGWTLLFYVILPMGVIDKGIAFRLIEDRVPMRGAEVLFLRKTLGLSLKDWADNFGLSAAGVLKWERALDKRLAPVNEAAVRAFCAEELGVEFEGTWSELIADDMTPKKVSVKLPIAA
jgi:hypothetical protein